MWPPAAGPVAAPPAGRRPDPARSGPLREAGGRKIPAPRRRVNCVEVADARCGKAVPGAAFLGSLESWHDVFREMAEQPPIERRAQPEDDLGGPGVDVLADAPLDGGRAVG